jgi:ABC-2 type transport system ATP-binding protein
LVSSHQLSEISLMADDLVVIGQGRLIEQCTVSDFIDRHADRWVTVKSPALQALRDPLLRLPAEVQEVDATTWHVRGATSAAVGEAAAAVGVVLHELSPQTGSLEDAFLKVTSDAQEYRTTSLGGTE